MIDPGSGVLLIADPFLKDPNFLRTVVLLCEYNGDGGFGFVLNRLHEYKLDELVPDLVGADFPVYYGGPVSPESIHFIHTCPQKIAGGTEIMNGLFWAGEFEKVIALLQSGELSRDEVRFFIGYSGWSEGQLAEEITEKTWLTAKATKKLVFHKTPAEIWKEAIKTLGTEFHQLVNFPIDPQLN